MAVLASDGQLGKRRIPETPVAVEHHFRPAAVALDTTRKDRATKAIVRKFIAWRQSPVVCLRVKRERSFDQIIIAARDGPKTIRPCTDDPIQPGAYHGKCPAHSLPLRIHFDTDFHL